MPVLRSHALLSAFTVAGALAQSNSTGSPANATGSIVSLPYSYTYLLPDGFQGNVNSSFFNGTTTSNSTINSALRAAQQAPFVAYDPEFYEIFGSNPEITLVQDRTAQDDYFAYEAGVWVPEKNEAWFSSSTYQAARSSKVTVLNLNTSAVSTLNTTGARITDFNGGYYFEGKVYFTTFPSNTTFRGGIYAIDVQTLNVEPVINSYFGLPFLSPDDVAWATQGSDKYMYFTDFPFSSLAFGETAPSPQLPSGVWRWDPQGEVLQQVITRNDMTPNGVRVSPDQRTLYVTDSSPTYFAADPSAAVGAGSESWLGPYIYRFDLDEDMYPVNRRPFGLVREYIADGMHVDDAGRVWTAEGEGIVIRKAKNGKVLGVVNRQYFLADKSEDAIPIANFALAGDKLVIGAVTRLYTVQLAKTIVSKDSSIVN
ncbi:Gluconolactonase [Pseudocercospora fuligena]|uniref:Gluconolactonase n=1 Tax=Pseudocercospora fuligena TaxID=685502 RepID=A0A8H6RF54_9PEZI|nr:Gluconolactonase [Pseudocercospora fuligena]